LLLARLFSALSVSVIADIDALLQFPLDRAMSCGNGLSQAEQRLAMRSSGGSRDMTASYGVHISLCI
jgi:hypothetical protein